MAPRNLNCSVDYFSEKGKRPRLLKALHFSSSSACFFVPSLREGGDSIPHSKSHPPAPGQSAMRVWHEEHLTMVAEQLEGGSAPSVRLTLYSRGPGCCVSQRALRHCRVDFNDAICHVSHHQVLVAVPNRLNPGRFEVLLWQWSPGSQRWTSYRRALTADTIDFLEPSADGLRLQIVRDADPHTCYEFHWFDQPQAWSLTSIAPACTRAVTPRQCSRPVSGGVEQQTLFARRSVPAIVPDQRAEHVRAEDQIDWQPGELFASLSEDQCLALIA
jgi:hypothetical protein